MTAPAVDRRASRRAAAGSQTGPAGRLPAPVKERRPALAALAVLLIVGGALASGLLVLRSGDRDDYLVVTRVIDPGQQITGDDLGTAQIAGTGANAIAAAHRSDVVGDYATTRIFPGTLVTEAMTADEWEIPDGQTIVGAVLATNQRPAARLSPGDRVAVLAVPRTEAVGVQQSVVLLDSAEVVDVEETTTNGAVAVSLLVPLAQVPEVTAAAAQGTIAVARLPGLAVPDRAAPDQPAGTQTDENQTDENQTDSGQTDSGQTDSGQTGGTDFGTGGPTNPPSTSPSTSPPLGQAPALDGSGLQPGPGAESDAAGTP